MKVKVSSFLPRVDKAEKDGELSNVVANIVRRMAGVKEKPPKKKKGKKKEK